MHIYIYSDFDFNFTRFLFNMFDTVDRHIFKISLKSCGFYNTRSWVRYKVFIKSNTLYRKSCVWSLVPPSFKYRRNSKREILTNTDKLVKLGSNVIVNIYVFWAFFPQWSLDFLNTSWKNVIYHIFLLSLNFDNYHMVNKWI